jgi:peptidoglycan/xylan/chitin deacetylase (PgdA/CDA1 family)
MIYVAVAAALLVVLAILHLFLPWGVRNLLRKRFLERVRASGCVCLTFDDGPNPETTPRIQALLDEAGIKATFFVTGEHAEQYPGLVHNLLAAGHEIGEHSYSHRHPWQADPIHALRDILRTRRALNHTLGPDGARRFRPPFGKLNFVTMLYTLLCRRPLAFWNLSPRDFRQPSAQAIVDHVLAHLSPGCVILLHDGRYQAYVANSSAQLTVEAVEILLREFATRNIHPVSLNEALGKEQG